MFKSIATLAFLLLSGMAAAETFSIECGKNSNKFILLSFDGQSLDISEYLPEGSFIKRAAGVYSTKYRVLAYKKGILKPNYISFFIKYVAEREGVLYRYTSRIRYANKGDFNSLIFESVPVDEQGFLTIGSFNTDSYSQCFAKIT